MPEALAHKLRRGLPLEDHAFDAMYPEWARELSLVHWTPVEVARRAAELLVVRPGVRVLDVGAGVGKFCLIGALATSGVFYGIEQRFHFVRAAQAAAARLGLDPSRFLHGNMGALDWRGFDAFYLYNPFAENLTSVMEPLDHSVTVDVSIFFAYVGLVRERLRDAPLGTRVVTYHGFGGELPPGYRLERWELSGTDRLELHVKRGA